MEESSEPWSWTSIFKRGTTKLPGRSQHGIKLHYELVLNPNIDHTDISLKESLQIIENFQKHGTKYRLYDMPHRSCVQLKRCLATHIISLHADNSVQVDLYEKLKFLMEHRYSVTVTKWAEAMTSDVGAQSIYVHIICNNRGYLAQYFGIEQKKGIVTRNTSGFYNKFVRSRSTKQRESFVLTQANMMKLKYLQDVYNKMNHKHTFQYIPVIEKKLVVLQWKPISEDDEFSLKHFHDFHETLERELKDLDDWALLKEYSSIESTKFRLYALSILNSTVEYSFSSGNIVDRVIEGIKALLDGKGCRSWYIIIIEKGLHFDMLKAEVVVDCHDYLSSFKSKFFAINRTKKPANVRCIKDPPYSDPDKFIAKRLQSSKIIKPKD